MGPGGKMVKRQEREEDEGIAVAVRDLDSAVHKGSADAKVKALEAIQQLLEPDDEQYSAHKELVEGGIAALLTQLLADESTHVTTAAARTVELLSRQSPSVVSRLAEGHTLGTFNPVQEALGDGELTRLLVEAVVGGGKSAEAANQALAALGSYNRTNRLAQVDELVGHIRLGHTEIFHAPECAVALRSAETHLPPGIKKTIVLSSGVVRQLLEELVTPFVELCRCYPGPLQAVELLDTLVSGMEMKDDLAVILDQALLTLINLVDEGQSSAQASAAGLLATIVEKRPAVADFIRNKGGLTATAQLLKSGPLATADVAVRTLWLLVKDEKDAKKGFAKMLGFPAVDLVDPLLKIIAAGHEYDKASNEATAEGGVVEEAEVDNDDEATLLLKALSAQDATVRARVKGASLESQTSCSIM